MALQLSSDIFATIVGNFIKLSNKTVILLDETFDYDDVLGSVARSFPQNLQSVAKAKCVIGSFTMPQVRQSGASVEATGPIKFKNEKTGTVSGFIIFDGDVSQSIISDDIDMTDKILLCSSNVSMIGAPGTICIEALNCKVGFDNTFYAFNLTFMGV